MTESRHPPVREATAAEDPHLAWLDAALAREVDTAEVSPLPGCGWGRVGIRIRPDETKE